MKKKIDKKIIFGIIIGAIVVGITGINAASSYLASNIEYKPKRSNWDVATVSEALDQLYTENFMTNITCNENIAEPNLGNKLIPITLSDDGTVTYADTSKEWYNYCEKKWANAVILIDTPSKEYKVNDIILEEDIEAYFVWIPKYKYKLWNTGEAAENAHSIDIVFDTTNTTDIEGESCATPMTSGNLGNCNNGEYMTHPAFISMDVDGFWAGKFETGYKGATTVAEAQVTSEEVDKIIVKPNVYSWRYNTLYNFFVAFYNYERDLNSHMIKNTEWGAIAYLSHSKYGIDTEVNINNNSAYRTGYSSLPSISQQSYPGVSGDGEEYNSPYNTEIGYLASTTGNITGIYDMSGGNWEYVAAYCGNTFGLSDFSESSIAEFDAKYFDVYDSASTTSTHQYMILGDATGEMGPFRSYVEDDTTVYSRNSWYRDYNGFIVASTPWFSRGASRSAGIVAGTFYSQAGKGGAHTNDGTRLVLSP